MNMYLYYRECYKRSVFSYLVLYYYHAKKTKENMAPNPVHIQLKFTQFSFSSNFTNMDNKYICPH